MRKTALFLAALACALLAPKCAAWSNGGYSADPDNPDYGTHDWVAEHALDWLPVGEKYWINIPAYLLGTELPDNPNSSIGGIGDTAKHHMYFWKNNGTVQDDAAAVRAQEEYDSALFLLQGGDYRNASIHAGAMTHYISDIAVWCHVMGAGTDWGPESNHSNYESYVNSRTSSYSAPEFAQYLWFDNSLPLAYAYESVGQVAMRTTYGWDGGGDDVMNCTWMNEHYNWANETFYLSSVHSLNNAINHIADLLHTLAIQGGAVREYAPVIITFVFSAVFFYLVRKNGRGPST